MHEYLIAYSVQERGKPLAFKNKVVSGLSINDAYHQFKYDQIGEVLVEDYAILNIIPLS